MVDINNTNYINYFNQDDNKLSKTELLRLILICYNNKNDNLIQVYIFYITKYGDIKSPAIIQLLNDNKFIKRDQIINDVFGYLLINNYLLTFKWCLNDSLFDQSKPDTEYYNLYKLSILSNNIDFADYIHTKIGKLPNYNKLGLIYDLIEKDYVEAINYIIHKFNVVIDIDNSNILSKCMTHKALNTLKYFRDNYNITEIGLKTLLPDLFYSKNSKVLIILYDIFIKNYNMNEIFNITFGFRNYKCCKYLLDNYLSNFKYIVFNNFFKNLYREKDSYFCIKVLLSVHDYKDIISENNYKMFVTAMYEAPLGVCMLIYEKHKVEIDKLVDFHKIYDKLVRLGGESRKKHIMWLTNFSSYKNHMKNNST